MVPCPDPRTHADSHKVWRALVKAGRVPTNDNDQVRRIIRSGVQAAVQSFSPVARR